MRAPTVAGFAFFGACTLTDTLRIAAIEPFFGGSHRTFLEGWRKHSRHQIDIFELPARKWKWRMRGAALHFAEELGDCIGEYDALFASDFLSLADFVALAPGAAGVPKVVYFHENQLTYPYRFESERDYQFPFTNITTCLAANAVLFNSAFHRREFLDALGPFLARMPDFVPDGVVASIEAKSRVLYLGVDLERLLGAALPERKGPALVLWNHRWEFDKAPQVFFATLSALAEQGVDFRLAVAGERYRECPEVFDRAKEELAGRIVHWGHLPSRADYMDLLLRSDIVVSTAIHEFFGVAVVEAVAAGCWPLLPNRLSYPELIPETLHARHLYDSDGELRRRLAAAIADIDEIRRSDVRTAVARFSWETCVDQYDGTIAEIVKDRAQHQAHA